MKRKMMYTLLVVAMICMCVGCKKKDQTQQTETLKQETKTEETVMETQNETETEQFETAGEDSWEDSADGWD